MKVWYKGKLPANDVAKYFAPYTPLPYVSPSIIIGTSSGWTTFTFSENKIFGDVYAWVIENLGRPYYGFNFKILNWPTIWIGNFGNYQINRNNQYDLIIKLRKSEHIALMKLRWT